MVFCLGKNDLKGYDCCNYEVPQGAEAKKMDKASQYLIASASSGPPADPEAVVTEYLS